MAGENRTDLIKARTAVLCVQLCVFLQCPVAGAITVTTCTFTSVCSVVAASAALMTSPTSHGMDALDWVSIGSPPAHVVNQSKPPHEQIYSPHSFSFPYCRVLPFPEVVLEQTIIQAWRDLCWHLPPPPLVTPPHDARIEPFTIFCVLKSLVFVFCVFRQCFTLDCVCVLPKTPKKPLDTKYFL